MFSKRKQTFFKNTRSDNLQLETDWPATFQLMLSLMRDSEIFIFYVNVYQNRGQARVRIWEVLGRLPGEPWKKTNLCRFYLVKADHPIWKGIHHTMLDLSPPHPPLTTPSTPSLFLFKILKPQTGWACPGCILINFHNDLQRARVPKLEPTVPECPFFTTGTRARCHHSRARVPL